MGYGQIEEGDAAGGCNRRDEGQENDIAGGVERILQPIQRKPGAGTSFSACNQRYVVAADTKRYAYADVERMIRTPFAPGINMPAIRALFDIGLVGRCCGRPTGMTDRIPYGLIHATSLLPIRHRKDSPTVRLVMLAVSRGFLNFLLTRRHCFAGAIGR